MKPLPLLLCLALGTPLSACLGGSGPPVQQVFFAYDGPLPTLPASGRPTLFVNPVGLPGYLQKPEIVYRVNGNQLKEFANAQWAEPPGAAITRYLILALSAARPDFAVQGTPLSTGNAPDAALIVSLDRFELIEGSGMQLHGVWRLERANQASLAGNFDASGPVDSPSPQATALAMQRALDSAVQQLAHTLPAP